jgi:hypothetical protein
MSESHRIIIRGRDADNGQFIPIKEAKRRKKTAIIDRMKVHKKPRKKGK